MQPTHVLAGLVVGDIDRAADFYARLLARPADGVPMPSCHEWRLGDAVTVQVHQNADVPAGHGSLALVVPSLDSEIARAGAASIAFGAVSEVSDFVRTATTSDPDGNRITLVESIAS